MNVEPVRIGENPWIPIGCRYTEQYRTVGGDLHASQGHTAIRIGETWLGSHRRVPAQQFLQRIFLQQRIVHTLLPAIRVR